MVVLPVEQPGAIEQIGLEHIERLHAVFHHQLQFARLGAVGKGPDIGTNCHGHAVLQLAVKLLHVIVEDLVLLRRRLRRAGVGGKILGDGKGGNGVDLPFAHQAHGLVAELVSMVDRGHPRLGGVQSARLTLQCTATRVCRRAASATACASCGSEYWTMV